MTFSPRIRYGIAAGLLLIMAALMFGAARRDSATVDETTALSAGYSYWKGHRFYFVPEHPPVGMMLASIPLLFSDVKLSDEGQALFEGRMGYPWTRPWAGPVISVQPFIPNGCKGHWFTLPQPPFDMLAVWQCAGSYPAQNWYLWALPECQLFGQELIYGSKNDGDRLLLMGRCVQIAITLAIGVMILLWVRAATSNDAAALVALAVWVFHPCALGYGHVITTDIGEVLGFTVALFFFVRFLKRPGPKTAIFWGISLGVALTVKLTAILLGPIFLLLLATQWRTFRRRKVPFVKLLTVTAFATWATILLAYFPLWYPPPPLPSAFASALGVPDWFQSLRPLLIPRDFFKALALTLGHSKEGHVAYLFGQWSREGWWYYYPVAFLLKSPLAFVALTIAAIGIFIKRVASADVWELTPWVGATVYLLVAMTSNVNIGVRHLLPMFPLVIVGIGCAIPRLKQWLVGGLVAWQVVICLLCAPLYLQFFSEAVGGASNGYKYLIDSNYDWGQDAKRLKAFLDERHIGQIYLDYFGTQFSIEYLKIPNTRIDAEKARQITQGWLVVSASDLMLPEWNWLRATRQPTARVADTLFVYQFP
jgi:hypothetical protein